jgi:hypothetical protein
MKIYIPIILLLLVNVTFTFAQVTYTEKELKEFFKDNPEYCDCEEESKKVKTIELVDNGKVSFMLSGGLNYLYGTEDTNNESFNRDYASWFGEAMLGYRYFGKNGKGGTTIALFGSFGNTSNSATERLLLAKTDNQIIEDNRDNFYYNIEGGVVLLQALRLSTGFGTQRYYLSDGTEERTSYLSSTFALHIGPENFKVIPSLNILYGSNFNETIYRPQLQLGLSF